MEISKNDISEESRFIGNAHKNMNPWTVTLYIFDT